MILCRRIILKQLGVEDEKLLVKYTNNPDLNKYSGPYLASTPIGAQKYIQICKKGIEEKSSFRFGIFTISNNFIGVIGFINLDIRLKKGEVGFWIAKEFWKNGYATEALIFFTEYIFAELKFDYIYAFCHKDNLAVVKVLKKSGFKKDNHVNNSSSYVSQSKDELIYVKKKMK